MALCLIVKNEEKNLRDCLGPVRDLFDKVVVQDTGSTDRTREIARELGAEVHEFAWCQDFAAARNESIKHAGTDWIFWLDADDRVDPRNKEKLRHLFAALDVRNLGFAMKCRCLCDPKQGVPTVVDHVRLFRNNPAIRWEFRVHEQILPSIRTTGGNVCFAAVEIVHVGYVDPALRRRKLERDLELLLLERHEKQDHPFTLFNLGMVYRELKQPQVALPLLQTSLKKSQSQDSIVRKLYSLIAACHRELGQFQQARLAYQEGRQIYPDDPELLFGEGGLLLELRDNQGGGGVLSPGAGEQGGAALRQPDRGSGRLSRPQQPGGGAIPAGPAEGGRAALE